MCSVEAKTLCTVKNEDTTVTAQTGLQEGAVRLVILPLSTTQRCKILCCMLDHLQDKQQSLWTLESEN